MKDKNTITKLKFVASLANIFEPFLKLFQTEGPVVHILHSECGSLVRRVFGRYLKADMLNKKIKEVDYKKGDNQIPNSEVKRGAAVSEKMPPELEIKVMREFYVTISRYLISRLPIDDDIMKASRDFTSIDATPTWNNKTTEETHCSCSSCSNRHRGGFRIGRVDSIYT